MGVQIGDIDKKSSAVVAVSGGVDSVALLDVLAKKLPKNQLTIAHFNHGIRSDSDLDEILVKELARSYDCEFVTEKVQLDTGASEDQARILRWRFLRSVASELDAKIYTAHHKNDLIETAIINILRGTSRRGLSSLTSGNEICRPLIKNYKSEIVAYATKNNLRWREDCTNFESRYLRNYIRNCLIPHLKKQDTNFENKILSFINIASDTNQEIDKILADLQLRYFQGDYLDRAFLEFDDYLIKEMLLNIARSVYSEFYLSSERLNSCAKFLSNYRKGKQFEFNGKLKIELEKTRIKFVYKV